MSVGEDDGFGQPYMEPRVKCQDWGAGFRLSVCFCLFVCLSLTRFFFCNVIMVLLYVHTKSIGWKIRLRPKTAILKLKMIQA